MTHCCDRDYKPAPRPKPVAGYKPGSPEYEDAVMRALHPRKTLPLTTVLLLLFPMLTFAQMPEASVYHDPRLKDTTLTLEQQIALVREEAAIDTRNLIEQIEALKFEICRLKEEQERMTQRILTGYWPKKQYPCSKGDEG